MDESSIKIKNELAQKIYKIVKETKKNSSYHVNIALKNYINEQRDLKIALKRLNNTSDEVISSKHQDRSAIKSNVASIIIFK